MLTENFIKPAQSEWKTTLAFAPYKNEELRFCIGYQKFNAGTMRKAYPILRMDECINSLRAATFFFTLDANRGY